MNKGKKVIQIEIDQMDNSSRTTSNINIVGTSQFGKPYSKTIAYLKLILTKKMAPIDKLFSLQKTWEILFEEIHDY